ncbi:hypothetical protein HID58_095940 [Brassica napus]|uniref:Uncharacterized protein n=1 Tax=Brassica napus TaxID=3708 RepID=A0ABQ7X4D0_BRANA|nr:hypothetical protein HID58_095940 [Brassica napus]
MNWLLYVFCFVLDISSMTNIIDRYGIQHACELRSLDLAENTRSYLPHNELLESVKSNLEESNVDNVNRTNDGVVKMLQERLEELLREENLVLASQGIFLQIGKTNGGRQNNSPANSSGINPPETLPLLK